MEERKEYVTKSSFRRPNGNASINASDELESNTEFEELETIAEKTATSVVDSDEELDSDDDSDDDNDSLPMKGEDYAKSLEATTFAKYTLVFVGEDEYYNYEKAKDENIDFI